MPYNADIADRVRSALADHDYIREVKMFGGLAFMVDERMVVCVSGGDSDLLVRVSPERDAQLVAEPGAKRADMGSGRSMGEGWLAVDEQALTSDDGLQYWLQVALDFHAQSSGKKAKKSGNKE